MLSFNHLLKNCIIIFLLSNTFGCSYLTDEDGIFRNRKNDYRIEETTPRMLVPENLDEQSIQDRFPIPEISPTADPEMIDSIPLPIGVARGLLGVVKIQKTSNSQWIFMQIPASQVWPKLKEFITKEGLKLTVENGNEGFMEAEANDGFYRFKIEQGFQKNTAELSIRFVEVNTPIKPFWLESSNNLDLESAMIKKSAQFFTDFSEKSAFSFAAQGINMQQRITFHQDEKGNKSLLLNTNEERALISVKQGLEKAELSLINFDEKNKIFNVQFLPQRLPIKKPGFFARLFNLKPEPFNDDVEYAGNYYKFTLNDFEEIQQLSVNLLDTEDKTPKEIRNEKNALLLLIKGRIY